MKAKLEELKQIFHIYQESAEREERDLFADHPGFSAFHRGAYNAYGNMLR